MLEEGLHVHLISISNICIWVSWEGSDVVLSLWTHGWAQQELGWEWRSRSWLQFHAGTVVSVSVQLDPLFLCLSQGFYVSWGNSTSQSSCDTPCEKNLTPKIAASVFCGSSPIIKTQMLDSP